MQRFFYVCVCRQGAGEGGEGCGRPCGGDVEKAKDLLASSLVDTLQLKQYWPSALRRIAALELQAIDIYLHVVCSP
jgi:hypothetical protein